ncbi:MAG: peptide-methionine (S)-S-oxide reductase MsrA [Candidatus Micrarchaeales archaeon]|jgi:peptide-methionine (S)-S-oxide reductase
MPEEKTETETIVLGGGCFWCTEAVFKLFEGVARTEPGYAGGITKNPSYEEICTGKTGHAEVLLLEYDSKLMPLEKIFDIFFTMHDPTSIGRQGNDIGSQYRSIILYNSAEQKTKAEEFIKGLQKELDKPILTEIKKLEVFYPAEGYHRDYYKKNRFQPYCALVIGPKIAKVKKKFSLH